MRIRASLSWDMDVEPEWYGGETDLDKMANIDAANYASGAISLDDIVPEEAVLNYHPISEMTTEVPRNDDGTVVTRRKFLHGKVFFGTQGEYDIRCVDEFCDKVKETHRHVESEIYLP